MSIIALRRLKVIVSSKSLKKREALENVLIPYTEDENKKMIKDAGFKHCETLFKWVNFATFIAIK